MGELPRSLSSFLQVVVPATVSAFSFGYILGRTRGSYLMRRRLNVTEGLSEKRVFVAVIPEQLFDSKVLAQELDRAVASNKTPAPRAKFQFTPRIWKKAR